MRRFLTGTLTASVVAIAAFGTAASADRLLYECDMEGFERNKGWTSPKIAFVLPGDGSVTVVDAIVLHFIGKPLEGQILRDSKTHTHIKWTVKDARADDGTAFANVDYKAVINKSSGRVTLGAKPRQFSLDLRDKGRCKTRTK